MIYKLPKKTQDIINKLKKAGFEAYAVGGCIRNLLIGIKTKDWDFTTNATPTQIQAIFPDSFYDNKFGTVGIPIKEKGTDTSDQPAIYEITTYRSESEYTDHRHPNKITWGKTITEDLQRRDFTINALAFDGNKLIDLFRGKEDIKNRIIKAVGEPVLRFKEDALRLIRAIRIATELDYTIDEDTLLAIKNNSSLIMQISKERIRDELIKIIASIKPHQGVLLLKESNLLSCILPELEKCFGVEQKSPKRHHIFDVGNHLLKSLEYCPSTNTIVRLATLLHDIGKPLTFHKNEDGVITFYNHEILGASIVRNIANRLHFSSRDRDKLVILVRFHQFTVDERQTDKAVRRFIRNVGLDNLKDILDLRIGDRLGGGARQTSWRLELFKKRLIEVQKQPFSISDLKIDGFDVMKEYKIGSGPMVGKILNMIFNDVIEGKIQNLKGNLIKRVKDIKKNSQL